jgi:hypothetical protein
VQDVAELKEDAELVENLQLLKVEAVIKYLSENVMVK